MDDAKAEEIAILTRMDRKLDELCAGLRETIASADRAIAHLREAAGSLDRTVDRLDRIDGHLDRLGYSETP